MYVIYQKGNKEAGVSVNGESHISLDVAKGLIVDALTDFDAALGQRAADILYNDARTNILETANPEIVEVQMYRPAGVTHADLVSSGMLIPDYAERFNTKGYGADGGPFTQQINDSDHGIIDLVYRGTPNAVSWLAHELGHAIADDIQIENGRSFQDFTSDEQEEQAYFVQNIVIDHLRDKFGLHDVRETNLGEPSLCDEFSSRASQFAAAKDRYEAALGEDASTRSTSVNKALDQRIATI